MRISDYLIFLLFCHLFFSVILRGITLFGVEAVYEPQGIRSRAWSLIEEYLNLQQFESIARVEPLHLVPKLSQEILEGKIRGRIVVDVAGHHLGSKL